jgi:PhnB protein
MMLADEFPSTGPFSPRTTGVTSTVFYLDTTDANALWARAVEHGAEVLRPLTDWFTGERDGQIVDPFGHRWGLSQHLRDVSREEVSAPPPSSSGVRPAANRSEFHEVPLIGG